MKTFLLVDEGSKYYSKRAIIGPQAKRHYMAFQSQANGGPALNAGLVALLFFRGSRQEWLRKPIFI